MNRELIEKFLDFAIENGFNFPKHFIITNCQGKYQTDNIFGEFVCHRNTENIQTGQMGTNSESFADVEIDSYYNIIELITSKEFIDAIVLGIKNKGLINIFLPKGGNIKITIRDAIGKAIYHKKRGTLELLIKKILGIK